MLHHQEQGDHELQMRNPVQSAAYSTARLRNRYTLLCEPRYSLKSRQAFIQPWSDHTLGQSQPFYIYLKFILVLSSHLRFREFTNTSIKIKIYGYGIVYIYKTLRYVFAPHQLEPEFRGKADGGASCRLYYESCLQRIHAKQITTKIIYESTGQRRLSHQWT
jgi:hypothetical protein